MAYRSFVRFWQALHPPRYAAFLKPSSPSFRHSSYNIDLMRNCWMYPRAPLDHVVAIRVDAAHLPRNFALDHDQSKVVAYPAHSPHGELEVRQDSCDGRLLARLPLPTTATVGTQFTLRGRLPATAGTHDLCLRFTAPIDGPYDAIGAVHLLTH